jgi:PAS domain S-box-containing protein
VAITEGIMGYVASQQRPLLVPDILSDPRFSTQARHVPYHSASFMIIPLIGRKFWGILNLADREDNRPFSARDLFLGWLLGRLFVEILEAREPQDELEGLTPIDSLVHEHIPLGLALLGPDFKVIQANFTMERLAGLKATNLVGQDLFQRLGLSSGDQEMLKKAFLDLLALQEQKEFTALKSSVDGKGVRFLGIKMFPSVVSEGVSQGFLLVEDVTEREQLKQRLHLYEHLAIMGKLSLCVAHELNNPLDGIRRYISLATRKKDDPQEVERYLTEAHKGLQKMSLTISSLLSSANPLKAPRSSDNLFNLLQDAIKIMMFQASDQRVEVSFHPSTDLRNVRVEGDVYHVFINVIKNALQAMPQGGKLDINGNIGKDVIEVAFQDTGPGLSREELESIFQPFYSTKEGTKGLGLGLPICRKILERYGGNMLLESQLGQGTKVKIILPKSVMGGRFGS